jgi:hypothetical protein
MKYFSVLASSIIIILTLVGCNSSDKITNSYNKQSIIIDENGDQNISITRGSSFDHPTFVIWIEDLAGNYIYTVYITKSYASGSYQYELVNDSIWLNSEGPSYQLAALPYWNQKKGLINGVEIVPTIENPYIDAYTGATPKTNFSILNNSYSEASEYRVLLEINQLGDWNYYWTNTKYPESNAYKNSAQPSLIYSVVIDQNSSEFYLNPIGHGDPLGFSGKLNTNLSTLTTAKEIIKEIRVTIK